MNVIEKMESMLPRGIRNTMLSLLCLMCICCSYGQDDPANLKSCMDSCKGLADESTCIERLKACLTRGRVSRFGKRQTRDILQENFRSRVSRFGKRSEESPLLPEDASKVLASWFETRRSRSSQDKQMLHDKLQFNLYRLKALLKDIEMSVQPNVFDDPSDISGGTF